MKTISHKFVEFVPDRLEDDTLYVSMKYATAVHKCTCGCGEKVITPFSPSDWALSFNGKVVSLYPSIGNWSFSCRSHYWIKDGLIVWADQNTENIATVPEQQVVHHHKKGLFGRMKAYIRSLMSK